MATSTHIKPLYRSTQIVWYVLYLIEIILLFRFLLRFIGANPTAGFTQFIYAISMPFAGPFLYVVESPAVGQSVFEWSTLLAMLVYWVIAIVIVRLVLMGRPVSSEDAQRKLDEQESEV
jgi:hypothetical protein